MKRIGCIIFSVLFFCSFVFSEWFEIDKLTEKQIQESIRYNERNYYYLLNYFITTAITYNYYSTKNEWKDFNVEAGLSNCFAFIGCMWIIAKRGNSSKKKESSLLNARLIHREGKLYVNYNTSSVRKRENNAKIIISLIAIPLSTWLIESGKQRNDVGGRLLSEGAQGIYIAMLLNSIVDNILINKDLKNSQGLSSSLHYDYLKNQLVLKYCYKF